MELKVKEVGAVEEKSAVQVEEQLLEKAEQQHQDETVEVNETPDIEKVDMSNTTEPEKEIETVEPEDTTEKESTQSSELNEEDVLSFIKNRYDKQINSVSDLLEERNESEELPEDVSAYFEYKKKTGRGIEDYVKLNRNFDDMPEDQLLTEYILATEEGLDKEDAELLMDDYSFDETLDDEVQVRKVKRALKLENMEVHRLNMETSP